MINTAKKGGGEGYFIFVWPKYYPIGFINDSGTPNKKVIHPPPSRLWAIFLRLPLKALALGGKVSSCDQTKLILSTNEYQ